MKDVLENAMKALFLRRYWSRRWIVQEINLPRKELVVFRWAQYSMPYSALNVILPYSEKAYREARRPEAMLRGFRNKDIFSLIDTAIGINCSDPRDRIYALLSLVKDVPITPNYTRSPILVFTDFARLAISSGKLTKTLWESCGAIDSQSYDAFTLDLPSWVPGLRGYHPEPLEPADRSSLYQQDFVDDANVLKVELYIYGICRYAQTETNAEGDSNERRQISHSARTSPASSSDTSPTTRQPSPTLSIDDWDRAMWDYHPENHSPDPPLWDYDPSETSALIYPWPSLQVKHEGPIDALVSLNHGIPSQGDLFVSTDLPDPCSVRDFEDDFSHTLPTLFLRPVDASSMTTFRLCGKGTIQYRQGAERPYVVREVRLV